MNWAKEFPHGCCFRIPASSDPAEAYHYVNDLLITRYGETVNGDNNPDCRWLMTASSISLDYIAHLRFKHLEDAIDFRLTCQYSVDNPYQ
jgi:hypothetical protein